MLREQRDLPAVFLIISEGTFFSLAITFAKSVEHPVNKKNMGTFDLDVPVLIPLKHPLMK
ncbi:hypothetical protein [Neobacillus mesonae]|uniref:Uncharacterized protein n=1 Tax=Neobacillus mesonae TaxID=1193713 RepID=A0A3T0HZE8_9BACI|nr:hypothetical protein [Neobacillus mesonae]AZU62506.1 hypothetical protein CHR53_15150 [Neobacillus mesonae]